MANLSALAIRPPYANAVEGGGHSQLSSRPKPHPAWLFQTGLHLRQLVELCARSRALVAWVQDRCDVLGHLAKVVGFEQ